jgi:hypothetical protein
VRGTLPLLAVLLLAPSCARLAEYGDPRLRGAGTAGAAAGATSDAPGPAAEAVEVGGKGTVRRVDEDGGFWGLRADDGRRYRLVDLPLVFQKDGTRIRFQGRVEPEGGGTWGNRLALTQVSGV